ncbi:MAG: hypothetical protein ABUU24_01850 [Variovorax sp.]
MTTEEIDGINSQIEALNGGRWLSHNFEQQDDGQFLLIEIEVDPSTDGEVVEAIRADVRAVLRIRVPNRESNYSWMGVIKKNGVVIQSLMGGAAGTLPEI